MTDMNQTKPIPMDAKKDTATHQADMLHDKIKETWPKLTDGDVNMFDTQVDKFYLAVKNAYHVEKMNVEKQIADFKKAIHTQSQSQTKVATA